MKNVVRNSTIRYLMRLSFLTTCLTIASLSLWAKNLEGQSLKKHISLKATGTNLNTILKQIARQTHLRLIYDATEADNYLMDSLDAAGRPADNLLDSLLAPTTLSYRAVNDLLVIYHKDEQEFGLKGRVLDGESKEPLPGVTVFLKGTKRGMVTNSNGGFTLASVKKGDVLIVSYVGYETKEVVISGDAFLSISL